MADIDRDRLAADVAAAKGDRTDAAIAAEHDAIYPAMLTRVRKREILSAANLLVVCAVFRLDPFAYLVTDRPPPARRARRHVKSVADIVKRAGRSGAKHPENQAITRIVPRETQRALPRQAPDRKTGRAAP